MLDRFRDWLVDENIDVLDTLTQPSLVMVKVRCSRKQTVTFCSTTETYVQLICHRELALSYKRC